MKHTIFSFILLGQLMCPVRSLAQRYEILKLSTPSIKINGKVMKVGSRFDDKTKIEWTDSEQMMKVRDHQAKRNLDFKASSSDQESGLKYVNTKPMSTDSVKEIPTPQQRMLNVVKSKRIALIDLLLVEIDRVGIYKSRGIDFPKEYKACSKEVIEVEVNDMSVEQLSEHVKLLDKWNKRFTEMKKRTE